MSSLRFGLIAQDKQISVPLQSVSVNGVIKGYVVGLDMTFNYKNSSGDPLEVMFRFPVDDGMAVVGLQAKIDNRTIRGVVLEKEEARATYDDAIASGFTAALGEEKSGDIFSLSLGNLPPQGDVQLILNLAGELPLEGEAVRFSLPTVLKPRYTPAGSSDPLAPVSDATTGSGPTVSHLSMQISNTSGVSSVTSPTHSIDTAANDDGSVNATLTEQGPLVKDLVILINYNDPHIPHATVEGGATSGSNELLASPVVMLDFFPKIDASHSAACEFVFVVDRSGSMRGSYINSARETLILFLKSIPAGCSFNIVGFGSRFEHLFPQSVPYNQSSLDEAMKHAERMDANLGGTELLHPLRFVFEQASLAGLQRQVFVLTDGSVSNTQACIDLTKANNHIARVFTFGIGSGASTALVNGLAKAGNGSAEFIKENERMQSKVISSLKKALQPSVTDVELKFSVPRGVSVIQAPSKIPPIFNGCKVVLYGIIKGKGGRSSAKLSGKILGESIEHVIEFDVSDGSNITRGGPVIHQLAAKSLIKDWESDATKKQDVINMSVQSSVVSSHTAYVAVDEDQNKPIEGAIKVWDLTALNARGAGEIFTKTSSRLRSYNAAGMLGDTRGTSNIMYSSISLSSGGVRAKKYAVPRHRNVYTESKKMEESSMESLDDMSDCLSVAPPLAPPNPQKNKSNLIGSSVGSGLSQLISLQSAEGYWSLDGGLAGLLGRSLDELKKCCPDGCSDTVWATLLALALLDKQYKDKQDEWELVAMKSDLWLSSQQLPSNVDSLKSIASKTLQ
jgi:hypothetical protein